MNRMEWRVIMDKFKSMTELESKTVEHEDWEIETTNQNSHVTILAIHGGGIEPATTESVSYTHLTLPTKRIV